MRPDDRHQFVSLIEILAESFGKEPSEAMVTGFWMGLQDLSLNTVNAGVRAALKSCETMPRPAHIRRLAGSAELGADHRATLAWQAVRTALARHGTYKSVEFGDPLINATIRNMGGWVELGKKPEQDFDIWPRKEFERIYETITKAGASEDDTKHLPGISEKENDGRFEVPPPIKIPTNYAQGKFKVLPSTKLDTSILNMLEGGGRRAEDTNQDKCESKGSATGTPNEAPARAVGI